MDSRDLDSYFERKDSQFEQICKRCGSCCGIENDPCEELVKLDGAMCVCRDYEHRIGLHKTVSGKTFHCIPITELLHGQALPPHCAYLKLIRYGTID